MKRVHQRLAEVAYRIAHGAERLSYDLKTVNYELGRFLETYEKLVEVARRHALRACEAPEFVKQPCGECSTCVARKTVAKIDKWEADAAAYDAIQQSVGE